jgi:hypothetical protein
MDRAKDHLFDEKAKPNETSQTRRSSYLATTLHSIDIRRNLPRVYGLAGRVVDGVGGRHGRQGARVTPCGSPPSCHSKKKNRFSM